MTKEQAIDLIEKILVNDKSLKFSLEEASILLQALAVLRGK